MRHDIGTTSCTCGDLKELVLTQLFVRGWEKRRGSIPAGNSCSFEEVDRLKEVVPFGRRTLSQDPSAHLLTMLKLLLRVGTSLPPTT